MLIGVVALAAHRVHAQVRAARLLNASKEPHNWLIYSGNYFSTRYSALNQITPANAKNLELKWMYQAGVAGNWPVSYTHLTLPTIYSV